MRPFEDMERKEGTLTKVAGPSKFSDAPEGTAPYYDVTSSNGWSCCISAEYGVVPKVGDAFVTWGGIGRPMRGQAINGRVLYYRTPDEQKVEDQKQVDAYRAKRVAEYEGKRTEYDARVAALPDPLRLRIEGFRAFKGDGWRYDSEPYELMCCEEAVKLAKRFNTAEALRRLGKLGYEAQKAEFPEMEEGHSGNSWAFSVRLAVILCERPDLVPYEHGALCPLVGCEEYGCFSSRGEPWPVNA
jgi:hypothetical protein